MPNKLLVLFFAYGLCVPSIAPAVTTSRILWTDPADITTRNLFYGPGGKDHIPAGAFRFVEEDLDGTTPKFVVKDNRGVKWKVKLGSEARPETVATRLIWAVGYSTTEDYFMPDLAVEGLPHLRRGRHYVASDGSVHNVRLKRYLNDEEKAGNWAWDSDAFAGTQPENGLRVLMALIGNWDLTGENNSVYQETSAEGAPELIYLVSDLGSTFGAGRLTWPLARSRGNLQTYRHSRFITNITPGYVDFYTPSAPALYFLATPREYMKKLRLRWIGRHIPRADARWTGELLARLSPAQIRDAFRSADYSAEDVEGFAQVVELRIRQLKEL